jgi:hypothetical protein
MMQEQKTPTPMSDAPARAEHLIEGLQRVESLLGQLSEAMGTVGEDLELLGRASYREGGGIRGVDNLLAAGASVDAIWGRVRGRCRAVGLERLLQRHTSDTDDDWVSDIAERLRRVVV